MGMCCTYMSSAQHDKRNKPRKQKQPKLKKKKKQVALRFQIKYCSEILYD